jgi:S-formylglutathione hydrolase FrmB
VDYCALLPASYDVDKQRVYPVLYLLHGLGDSSRTLITTGVWNLIDDLQASGAIGEFIVITPEGGRTFYIDSKDGKVPYEDFFIREFIPQMQKKYRIGTTRAQRAIAGISMGGYGALRFAFKYPQMFTAVAAHMPALMERMPPGAANTGISGFMGNAFGHPLDSTFWDAHTPFIYARTADLSGLKIYFDCGDRDSYGFDAGSTALHQLLLSRKIPHEFHLYPGTHGWEYVSEHIPASLEFVSRALAVHSQSPAKH